MTALWHFHWPLFVAAAILGLVAGVADFRKQKRNFAWLGAAAAAAAAVAFVWYGPGGAGERLARSVERSARVTLDNYEMTTVTARLERKPLSRTLVLSGPADDFQQRELVRILGQLPGVGQVRWDRPLAPSKGL